MCSLSGIHLFPEQIPRLEKLLNLVSLDSETRNHVSEVESVLMRDGPNINVFNLARTTTVCKNLLPASLE